MRASGAIAMNAEHAGEVRIHSESDIVATFGRCDDGTGLYEMPLEESLGLALVQAGLAEYSRNTGRVLVRSDTGPCLVADPWYGLATTWQR